MLLFYLLVLPIVLTLDEEFYVDDYQNYKIKQPTYDPKSSAALEQNLLLNYTFNRSIKKGNGNKVSVNLLPVVQHLVINEKDQKMTFVLLFIMQWRDRLLSWNPKDYEGISSIALKSYQVWFPMLVLTDEFSAKPIHSHPEFSEYVTLDMPRRLGPRASANVVMQYRYLITVDCIYNFDDFPNDLNQCGIRAQFDDPNVMMNLINHHHKLDFSFSKKGRKQTFNGFEVLNLTLTQTEPLRKSGRLSSQRLTSTVYFKRDAPYFNAAFIYPILICSILNVLSFFTPTIFQSWFISFSSIILSFVFLKDFSSKIPPVSVYLPRCIYLYGFVMFSSFLVLVFHFVTVYCLQHGRRHVFLDRLPYQEIPLVTRIRIFVGLILTLVYTILFFKFN